MYKMYENQKINKINNQLSKPNLSYSYYSDVINENFLLEKYVNLRNSNEMIQEDKHKFFKNSNKEDKEHVPEKILGVKKKIPENKFTYNLGHWSKKEHQKFLLGLCLFENDYERISEKIKTRSVIQVRSHSQKFFKKYKEKLLKNEQLLTMKEKISSYSIKQLIKIFSLCKKNKNSNLKIKEMLSTVKKRRIRKLGKSTFKCRSHKKYLNNVIIYFTSEIKDELPDFTLESPIFIERLIKNVPNLTKLYLFCQEIEKQWIDKLKSLEERMKIRGGKIPREEEQNQN